MSRLLSAGVTLATALSVLGATHYYAWARLVRDVAPPQPLFVGLTVLFVALCLGIPLNLVLHRLAPAIVGHGLLAVTLWWMGTFFVTLTVLLGAELLRLLFIFASQLLQLPPLLPQLPLVSQLRLYAAAVAVVALGLSALAWRSARAGPQVTRVPVSLARFPAALDGLTIAQISDLHVAPLLGRAYVEEVVRRVQALQPSLVVFTGDMVDGSVPELRDGVSPLADLKAPYGSFFITGNHEYYAGADSWAQEFSRLGAQPLRNARVSIGTPEASFDLAGVDDYTGARFGNGGGADFHRALAGRDPQRELVLLAHQPKAIFEAAQQGVGLLLSGHTHGGQIWPFGYLVRLAQPYLWGLSRHGGTQIYVNRGTGYWGPPMRLGAPPEVTLLELRRG